MTTDEAHDILFAHALTLVYLPNNSPYVWGILPHVLHPSVGSDDEVSLVAIGSTPEEAVEAWRNKRLSNENPRPNE